MMDMGRIEFFKEHYPKGTRIQVDKMGDDPNPILNGVKGTVVVVDDIGTLHCEFDDGRTMGICPEVDKFHKLFDE